MNDEDRKKTSVTAGEAEDDEIIELTRVVKSNSGPVAPPPVIDEVEIVPAEEETPDEETPDVFDEDDGDLGRLVADVMGHGMPGSAGAVTLPVKELEQVLERVILKAYGDKIEVMVMNMIEKKLKIEIEKINTLIWKIAHDGEEES